MKSTSKYIFYSSILVATVIISMVIWRAKEELREKPIQVGPQPSDIQQLDISPKQLSEKRHLVAKKLSTDNPYDKQEAIRILMEIGGDEGIDGLEKILQQSLSSQERPVVIIKALYALGALRSARSLNLVEEVYMANERRRDGYAEAIHQAALYAIGEIGSKEAIPFLSSQLQTRKLSFTPYLLEAFEKIASKESITALEAYKSKLTAMYNAYALEPKDNSTEINLWQNVMEALEKALQASQKAVS